MFGTLVTCGLARSGSRHNLRHQGSKIHPLLIVIVHHPLSLLLTPLNALPIAQVRHKNYCVASCVRITASRLLRLQHLDTAMNGNNGFGDSGINEDNFGESGALNAVKAFDAFPKTKPSYTEQSHSGGIWTIVLVLASIWLGSTELGRWWTGETTHTFSVEQGIGHDLQINLDVVVHMRCEDLHVNVQDASGDRILAGSKLNKDPTSWVQWGDDRKLHYLPKSKDERLI